MAGAITSTNNITLPNISARLTHIFRPGIVEALNSQTDLFQAFRSAGRVVRGKGNLIEAKFHHTRNSGAGWNTETGAIGSAGVQGYYNGYGSWYIAQVPFQVTDLKADVANGATADGIASILEDEISRAMNDLMVVVEKALAGLQSGLANSCYGVQDAVYDGSTGTYFGINRANYGFMRNTVLGNGSSNRAISKALLNQCYRTMVYGSGADKTGGTVTWASADQGGSRPTHILTTGGIIDKYDEVVAATSQTWIIGSNADPGVKSLTFKGVPLIGSRFLPSNQARFIDINDFELHILPHTYSLRGEDSVRESEVAVKFLGRTGSFVSGYLEIRLNLVCVKPGNQVLLDDITE